MIIRTRAPRAAGLWRRATLLLAALLAAPIIAGPLAGPTTATPAIAASLDGMMSFAGYHVGAFTTPSGARVYCLEPGADAPLSPQREPARVFELPAYSVTVDDAWGWRGTVSSPAVSGEQLRQMNWLLNVHGESADARKAVAVQIALWEIRRGPGTAAWIDGKHQLFRQHGGGAMVDEGIRLAGLARASAIGPRTTEPRAQLTLREATPDRQGYVDYPAGTTELVIEGGVFADGTTRLLIADGAEGSAAWRAAPHSRSWSRTTEVAISGRWEVAETYWPAELILYPSTRHTEQRIGGGVAPVRGTNTGPFGGVVTVFEHSFEPAITTAVSTPMVARANGVFSDAVTVSAGTTEWPARFGDGAFLPVLANGTLYGPFEAPQVETDAAPADAPVAGVTELTIDGGPGTYQADLAIPDSPSGYYYWVWEIREDSQSQGVRDSGIFATGAVFADRFAVDTERQTIASELRWETQLERSVIEPGRRVLVDSVRATSVNGAWLLDADGQRIPATVRLTVYETSEQPVRSSAAPTSARKLGSVPLDLVEPDVWAKSAEFVLPNDAKGWVTVQACLFTEDQAEASQGLISEWCDDFGVPAETARLAEPQKPGPVTKSGLAKTGGAGTNQEEEPLRVAIWVGSGALLTGAILVGSALVRRRTTGA